MALSRRRREIIPRTADLPHSFSARNLCRRWLTCSYSAGEGGVAIVSTCCCAEAASANRFFCLPAHGAASGRAEAVSVSVTTPATRCARIGLVAAALVAMFFASLEFPGLSAFGWHRLVLRPPS